MWHVMVCVLGSCLAGTADDDSSKMLAGHWALIGNGNPGELIVSIGEGGKVAGTIYNQAIEGTYDAGTKRLSFKRIDQGRTPVACQAYEGVLAEVANARPRRFTLEGKFRSIAGPKWGEPDVDYAWTARATRLPSPAEDLKNLQGAWEITGKVSSLGADRKLPVEAGLNDKGATVTIRDNQLLSDGKLLATFANDVALAGLIPVATFDDSRPLLLTLSGGKAVLCRFSTSQDGLEIIYPFAPVCRGGGVQIVSLKRLAGR